MGALPAFVPPETVQAPPGLDNLPRGRDGLCVGRDDALARLEEALAEGSRAGVHVVHGPAGVGKSTLALRCAQGQRERCNPIWWINADTPVGITAALADLAARLAPDMRPASMPSVRAAAWATAWLQSHTGWLLVFDHAPDPQALARVIAPLSTGRHLITSRRTTGWDDFASPVALDVLSERDAVAVLRDLGGQEGDPHTLAALAAEAGWLPLALELTAAYIRHAAVSPSDCLAALRRLEPRDISAPVRDEDRVSLVARLERAILDSLTAEQPLAGDILRTLAWLAPSDVPRALVHGLRNAPLATDVALARLHAHRLITLEEDTDTVTTHRLVQAAIRTSDPADPHRMPALVSAARQRATVLLHRSLTGQRAPVGTDGPATVPSERQGADRPSSPTAQQSAPDDWTDLLPHVEALAAMTASSPSHDTEDTAALLHSTSVHLLCQGHAAEAVAYARRSVRASTGVQGDNRHPLTLAHRDQLAVAHEAAGHLHRAIALYRETLTDRASMLGNNHPDTLTTSHRLATAYLHTIDPARTVPLFERILAARARLLGEDHHDTLTTRNNLAAAHCAAGNPSAALTLFEQTLSAFTRTLGAHHPAAVAARHGLATAHQAAGTRDRAIPLYEQILADRVRTLGEDHPDTFALRTTLADAHEAANDFRPAIAHRERIAAHRVRTLGEDHPDTLAAHESLAADHLNAGDAGRAIPLYEELATRRASVLGEAHADTLRAHSSLAVAYVQWGDCARGAQLHERVLADRVRELGYDHPDTLDSSYYLAVAYEATNNPRVLPLYRWTLTRQLRVLGEDDLRTVDTRVRLARACQRAGEYGQAIEAHEAALAVQTRVLGPHHPFTLRTITDLGDTYHSAGDLPRALRMYEQALPLVEEAVGEDDPWTRAVRVNLDRVRSHSRGAEDQ